MKQKHRIFILCFCFYLQAEAQNLVRNPSFEDTLACPTNAAQVFNAVPWYDPNGCSSDYFNGCTTNGAIDVPKNGAGFQYARTGIAYAGFATYYQSSVNYREYIQAPLLSSLVANKIYCVSFYLALGDSLIYSSDKVGCFFSSTPVNICSCCVLPFIPQIETTFIITDTIGWTKISGTFIASGGEQYITIGNFKDDSNTNTSIINNSSVNPTAYFFIDDISVTDCDTVTTDTLFIPNVFTPNYDGVNDLFEIKGLIKGDKVQIFNRWGTLVFETESEKMFWDGFTTSGEPCSGGVYYYVVTLVSGETRKGYLTLIK